MLHNDEPNGGDNFSLRDILLKGRKLSLSERTKFFSDWINTRASRGESLYLRIVTSMSDREVETIDPISGEPHRMLMFGSNNYLGLTSHPYVRERVLKAVEKYGSGIGGPPLLNGYTTLHAELEERLSAMKRKEDTLVFQSGYGANVGLVSCLAGKHDTIVYDIHSHASFYDGIQMADAPAVKFAHNDMDDLDRVLSNLDRDKGGAAFVGVEGVYSMDGTLAPLDKISRLCRKYDATLIIDDAHGTGVAGPGGRGAAEHFGVAEEVDLAMGTFSKAFGVVGGFVSTSKPMADYLRFFARSYMFSSSLPPAVLAAVIASLDLLENDPSIHRQLLDNMDYLGRGLRRLGFDVHPESAIVPLAVPPNMNIRKAAYHFHRAGIFINSIEYPAVPAHQQRFRISLMATHTCEDINRLLEVVEEVWHTYNIPVSRNEHRASSRV